MQVLYTDQTKRYDYIIVGGGVAGMSLAYQLINSPLANCSILMIDQRAKDRNDRTLSFWSDGPLPFDEIVYHTWDHIRFESEDFTKEIELGNYKYKTIRGIDFYEFVQKKLDEHPNVVFLKGRVEAVEEAPDGAYVRLEGQQYFGKWVFDSRLRPYEYKHESSFGKQVLRQYFKGWVLQTPNPTFDADSATLFDFRVPQEGDMRFFYLLPFSEKEALVEYVGLERTDYDAMLQQYVEQVLKIGDYEAKPIEGGAILLTDRSFKRHVSKHVLTIGSAGGMIKPSSGYAFTRILKDSEAIVESLVKYGHPFKIPAKNPLYYLMDSLMLEAMYRFTGKMKMIFTGMFKYNPAQRVFRFLDERTAPWEVAAMILTIPCKHLFIWTVLTDEKRKKRCDKTSLA